MKFLRSRYIFLVFKITFNSRTSKYVNCKCIKIRWFRDQSKVFSCIILWNKWTLAGMLFTVIEHNFSKVFFLHNRLSGLWMSSSHSVIHWTVLMHSIIPSPRVEMLSKLIPTWIKSCQIIPHQNCGRINHYWRSSMTFLHLYQRHPPYTSRLCNKR